MIYWICYFLMTIIDRIYLRTEFYGREHIPPQGGFIIASNHISNLDPLIVGMCSRRRFSYLAKEELFNRKLLAFWFHHVGTIPIKRDTSDFRAIRESIRKLKNGCPLILFPEGTRGVSGRTKKVQPGIGLIVLKSELPVLPVFIQGSDLALPSGAKWFKRHTVKVKIGAPLSFTKGQTYLDIAHQIMSNVYSLSN